jgi:hypothetical protein
MAKKTGIGILIGKLGGKSSDKAPEDDTEEMPAADLDGLASDVLAAIKSEDSTALRSALEAFCVSCSEE